MKHTFFTTLIILLGSLLTSAQEVSNMDSNFEQMDQQDDADCCYWINRTGRFMGEANAFLEITRIRERISPFDQSIYALLQNASSAIENAAIACEPSIPAWPYYREKQNFLANQIRKLQETTNHKLKRAKVYNQINDTYVSWANPLSVSKFNGRVINNTTCATCYYQLGYSTAYAAQAFRQAEEVLRLQNDEEVARKQINLAREYLTRTNRVLKTYYEIQQPRGSFLIRCAYLGELDLENRIDSLISLSSNINNIFDCCDQAQSISLDIQDAMAGCEFNRNYSNNENEDSNANGNTYEKCRSKYCPECDNSIVVFGEAVDKECQECLDKNKELIEQCMKGRNTDIGYPPNPDPIVTKEPAIPDCPSYYLNSIAVWNNVTNQYDCDCIHGYVWNTSKTECIEPKPDCNAQYPNTVAKWNANVNKYECDCIQGFEWNYSNTACIESILDCNAQYPNTVAVWNNVSNQYECDCIQGYEWNIFNECIKSDDGTYQDSEVQPPNTLTYSSCPMQNPDPGKSSHVYDTNGIPDDGTHLSCKYFGDGALEYQSSYLNKKKDGLFLYYGTALDRKTHPIGDKINYKNDKKHGLRTIYSWCQTKEQRKSKRTTRYKSSEILYDMNKVINKKSFPSGCAEN